MYMKLKEETWYLRNFITQVYFILHLILLSTNNVKYVF